MNQIEYHVVYPDGTCAFWGNRGHHTGFRMGPGRSSVMEETPISAYVPKYETIMLFFKKCMVRKNEKNEFELIFISTFCHNVNERTQVCIFFEMFFFLQK